MFVRKSNNRQLASFMLTLFLLTSILSQSPALLGSSLKSFGFVITKSKAHGGGDFQFPYEKNEKEEKQSAEEDKSIFITLIPVAVLFTISDSQEYSFYTDPRSCGSTTQTPLYLSNRTLLI
jgi:hypothetical protein